MKSAQSSEDGIAYSGFEFGSSMSIVSGLPAVKIPLQLSR